MAEKPGDFILPFDVLDVSQTRYSLSGKITAASQSMQLFRPQLAGLFQKTAKELWPSPTGSSARITSWSSPTIEARASAAERRPTPTGSWARTR